METKECPSCKETKTPQQFFKNHNECRSCVIGRALPLTTKVEQHRQNKMLREELKKIAKVRMAAKRRKRKEKKIREFVPAIQAPEDAIVVDPAMKELAQRTLSRRRLIEFIQEFHPRYKAGWVHHKIARVLEKFAKDVADGKSPRLMILMPPRHGKSQIASKMFPAWVLGHYNYFEVMACSYNIALALEFSREVRDVVRSERYSVLFPDSNINPEIQSAEAWKLLSKTGVGAGGYVAAGVGGAITGKGAHILIIDDPIKNAEEAESPEQRKKIWDWYTSTAYTRLAPGGGVLIIQTCWHDDDLAGRLQAQMKADPDADQFEIIKFPAIAIEEEEFRMAGDPLHPDRYDSKALEQIKRTLGLRYWAALYQQDPVPDEGAFFTKEMMKLRGEVIRWQSLPVYQAWDFAISTKQENDFNVGATGAHDPDDVIHVLEVDRFKTKDAGVICDHILDNFERYGANAGVKEIAVEDGQIWRTMQTTLRDRMRIRRLYPTFTLMKPLTDKQVRARPLQGRMQALKVTFPRAAGWMEATMRELLRFPSGVNDDVVDALAWLAHLIAGRTPPKRIADKTRSKEKTTAQKIAGLGRGTNGAGPMAA